MACLKTFLLVFLLGVVVAVAFTPSNADFPKHRRPFVKPNPRGGGKPFPGQKPPHHPRDEKHLLEEKVNEDGAKKPFGKPVLKPHSEEKPFPGRTPFPKEKPPHHPPEKKLSEEAASSVDDEFGGMEKKPFGKPGPKFEKKPFPEPKPLPKHKPFPPHHPPEKKLSEVTENKPAGGKPFPDPEHKPFPEHKPEPKPFPEHKPEPKPFPEHKPEPKPFPEHKPEPKPFPEHKPEPKPFPEPKPEPKPFPEPKHKPFPEHKPPHHPPEKKLLEEADAYKEGERQSATVKPLGKDEPSFEGPKPLPKYNPIRKPIKFIKPPHHPPKN